MIKQKKKGVKKGIKLMPNHFDYFSSYVRWIKQVQPKIRGKLKTSTLGFKWKRMNETTKRRQQKADKRRAWRTRQSQRRMKARAL